MWPHFTLNYARVMPLGGSLREGKLYLVEKVEGNMVACYFEKVVTFGGIY